MYICMYVYIVYSHINMLHSYLDTGGRLGIDPIYVRMHTYTHTHTHIYIHIYMYV